MLKKKTKPNRFNKSFIAKQKKILKKREKMIEKELEAVAQKKKSGKWQASFPDYGRSEDDSVFEFEDYDKNVSVEKNLNRSLKEIRGTIKQIKKGKYGICASCNKEIPEGRLNVYPAASLCVECKSKPGILKRIWPFSRR